MVQTPLTVRVFMWAPKPPEWRSTVSRLRLEEEVGRHIPAISHALHFSKLMYGKNGVRISLDSFKNHSFSLLC